MRRLLLLAILATCWLPLSRPAEAQATADQLNKLSLEALTARPAGGGGGGYVRRTGRAAAYTRPRYQYARRYHDAPAYRRVFRNARTGRPMHLAPVAFRGRPTLRRSVSTRPTAYHLLHRR